MVCFYGGGILKFIYSGIISRGETIIGILHNFENDTFMDLFNSMQYGTAPYERGVIYPPLANLMYYFFSRFIPQEIFEQGTIMIRDSQIGRTLLAVYITITTLFLVFIILKVKKGIYEEKFFFVLTILLSMPFLFQLERGNLVLITLIFVMIFIWGYDSDNKFVKHVSFLSLAIATAIKIYPVILGLILIRNKKWKDVITCVIYGVIIFFVPFTFLGGWKNIILFFNNVINTTDYMKNAGYGLKVNISNTFGYLGILLMGDEGGFSIFSIILKLICLIGGVNLILFAKFEEKWKLYMVPALMMVLIPDFSFLYMLILLVPSLIYFLDSDKKIKILDVVYLMLFVCMFIPMENRSYEFLNVFAEDYYPLTTQTIIKGFSVLAFMIVLWCEEGGKLLLKVFKNKDNTFVKILKIKKD